MEAVARDSKGMDASIFSTGHFPFFHFEPNLKPGRFILALTAFLHRHRASRDRADFRRIRYLIRNVHPLPTT